MSLYPGKRSPGIAFAGQAPYSPAMELMLIVAVGAIVAGFIQGLSGFAFGLVAMSFWAWGVEPQLAAVLTVFGSVVGQLIAAASVRRAFEWPMLLPFLVGGLVGIPIGVMILPLLDVHLFKFALGSLLVVWCPLMLFSQHVPRIPVTGAAPNGIIGLIGGVLGGIGGFAGVIPTLWCTLSRMPKDQQRNIIQNFNLAVAAVTMIAYVVTGTVTTEMLPMLGMMVPILVIPTLLGTRIYIGISEAAFRKVVLTCLTLSGIALLLASVPSVLF